MNLFLKMYDKEILKHGLYAALLLWGLTTSVALLMRKDHLVVVKVDDYGTTVLSEENAAAVTIESENFINEFIGYFYTYTSENYDNHIDRSFVFLDGSVANTFIPKLNETSKKVKLTPTQQNAFATKITRIKEGRFEVELSVSRTTGSDESKDNYKIEMEVERTRRSMENPYGLLVVKLEEIYE